MKRYLIAAALGAGVLGGVAYAQADQAAPAPQHSRPGDTNGDGTMSRDEFVAQSDKRFDRLDYNRDGKVSEETFMALTMRGGPGGMHGMRGMRGPGMRGPGMHRRGGPDRGPEPMAGGQPPAPNAMPGAARGVERIKALDTNRDGWVDRAEFRAQAGAQFAKLDANNDGRVDAAERAAPWLKLRDARGMGGMRGPGGTPPRPGTE